MGTNDVEKMERKSMYALRAAVKECLIFIDTCSLLTKEADAFWKHIEPILIEENKYIIVPFRVYQEVEKFANNLKLCQKKQGESGNELNSLAKNSKKKILELHKKGLIQIFGEKSDNFADNVFETQFTRLRMKYSLMLITQDRNLTDDMLRISESKAITVNNKTLVRRINKHGYLSISNVEREKRGESAGKPEKQSSENTEEQSSNKNTQKQTKKNNSNSVPKNEMFALADNVVSISGVMNVSFVPKENDVVVSRRGNEKREVKLGKELSSGGEGVIYATNIPNVVAKIYKPDKIIKAKYEKLKLMITKDIDCKGVCFPMSVVYNKQNEFVGFLMKKARGKELQKCVFIPQLLRKQFPDWTKRETVKLCLSILEKIKYLHDRNIILGDINPNNILVVSPEEVYFVDTDSYQIGGYPCPVGTINFTAPEIQRKEFNVFLRTVGNERFAVATLLFMIMLPGKPPYALQGGENQIENIVNGNFAYVPGEKANDKIPEGFWRYIWSHLPKYLQNDFYETFRKGQSKNSENARLSDSEWIKEFKRYSNLLSDENNEFLSNDIMSLDLFPSRFKKEPDILYIKCKLCGREIEKDKAVQGYCRRCLVQGETYHCARCGANVVYTNYRKLVQKAERFDYCKDCNDRLNSVCKMYPCANPNCQNPVEITYLQNEKFETQGKPLPKYCKVCKEKYSKI